MVIGYDHEVDGTKVNALLCPDTRTWDTPFIRGIFNEEDVEEILSTPIPSRRLGDRVV